MKALHPTALILTVGCLLMAGACLGDERAPARVPSIVRQTPVSNPEPVAGQATATDQSSEGQSYGPRPVDLTAHVYDGAVANYLLENTSGIGREIRPQSDGYVLPLLVDDGSYERCVTTLPKGACARK